MSLKWTRNHSESGILRKSDVKEKKEELFVFGYSCKLFRDDEKALHIDQGKHLIPWMGDDTLKIDRYDARGALHDLSALEAPPGGFDWRMELTRNELDVEQLCDEERYRAMHTDEDEEEMYKEEELKRLHAAGYGQVGFNYENEPAESESATPTTESEEPFIPSASLKALLPPDVVLPDTEKLNAIVEKTARFIASQGAQMEILLRAKQADNPQFQFLSKESPLHAYYTALTALLKSGKWPDTTDNAFEDKHPENENENEEYLHPSLGSTMSIESAPSIPSIHYRPSADCDYTLLISKIVGRDPSGSGSGTEEPPPAPGDPPPPGTRPLTLPPPDICRPPMIYTQLSDMKAAAVPYYQHYPSPPAPAAPAPRPAAPAAPALPLHSTGLSLMKNYNTDSDSDASESDTASSAGSPAVKAPPEDVQLVIDKMAAYVARNGDEFADIVRAKNDPRFVFLEPDNEYHAFYLRLMNEKRGEGDKRKNRKAVAPVSFSIKKLKEPEPVLQKPALPYESSSDEESDPKPADAQPEPHDNGNHTPITINRLPPTPNIINKIPQTPNITNKIPQTPNIINKIPQAPIVVPPVNRIDVPIKQNTNSNDVEKRLEVQITPKIVPPIDIKIADVSVVFTPEIVQEKVVPKLPEAKIEVLAVAERRKEKSATPERKRDEEKMRERYDKRDKKYKERSEYRDRSEARVSSRSLERERRRQRKERVKRKRKYSREEMENEIISLEDNDELIDLTEDQSDAKVEGDTEADRAKQQARRRRAAEFLKKVGVDPAAAALPTSSLASAMVDTLESIRKKKAEEEEKRRKREKRKRRYDYNGDRDSHRKKKKRRHDDDTDESDYDSSKRRKRKKDKKSSAKMKKRRRASVDKELIDQPLNIDLLSTLKELRTSPTRELCFATLDDVPDPGGEDLERRGRGRREEREYSEGEWSSDSEADSFSSAAKESD